MKRNRLILACLLFIVQPLGTKVFAQEKQFPKVEIFAGAELNYRDIFYSKMYEVLLNLTPGVKWHIGRQWQLAGQVVVPVWNDYGARYKRVRLNMAVLSKEWDWKGKQFLKVSGGLFGRERYGLDAKWMYPIKDWVALDGQLGVTGFCSMAAGWECSPMKRVTGQVGLNFYLQKVNTEFRLHGGRYVFEDYGVIAEAMRHFRHCTVGVYALYSDKGKETAGFKVLMMIPPYKRRARKVMVRPATNFRLTYDINGLPYAAKMYTTDPEENEREGHFDRNRLQWGVNRMTTDFSFKEGGRRK